MPSTVTGAAPNSVSVPWKTAGFTATPGCFRFRFFEPNSGAMLDNYAHRNLRVDNVFKWV